MEVIKRIFCLLGISLLSGCTTLGTYMSTQDPAPQYLVNGRTVHVHFIELSPTWIANHNQHHTYRLGPYDVLNIIVWDHPELTTQTTQLSGPTQSGILVDDDGNIFFPFAGTFNVSGLSIPQVEQKIARKIAKYIRNPQVSVRVVDFRSQEVQVMGEIGEQRTLPLTDKPMTLFDAINKAGGTNLLTANTNRIYIIRGSVTNLTVFFVSAKSPQMMMAAQTFYLKRNDIVYVPPLPITNWNRVISQLLPTMGAAAVAKATTGMPVG